MSDGRRPHDVEVARGDGGRRLMLAVDQLAQDVLQGYDIPMLRHVAERLQARRLKRDAWIEPACDGAMDGGLFLFVQQPDQRLLGSDRASDPSIGVVEKAHNRGLLSQRWN